MPVRTTRVYLAYAEGDDGFRDLLIEEARKAKAPVEFVYMPSKQPWVRRWKAACLARALECHGAIAAITRRTGQAEGMGAELDSVCEAAIPVLGVGWFEAAHHVFIADKGPGKSRRRRAVDEGAAVGSQAAPKAIRRRRRAAPAG
jgi:hypothetical protein